MTRRGNDRFVVRSPEGGWDIKAPRARRASGHFGTQAEAEERAKEIVRNLGGGEVAIQGTDGRFRDSDTVPRGIDPYPPKDKKH